MTLTIREALVDEKNLYLILDYQLPDTVDRKPWRWLTTAGRTPKRTTSNFQMVTYYATGDIAWEDLKAAEQDTWATLDWTDRSPVFFYGKSESTLNRIGRVNGSSGLGESQGYDQAPIPSPISVISPETRTAWTSPPSP
ncbi:hypothetical protein [Dysosmobacter welbionis]|uniref:hypothetical protein n=1 Tax=Dysosmobacter welbionis TaxID=2093857 RepID=UPI00300EF420